MQLTDLQSTSKDDTALVQAYTYIALFRGRTRGGISTFALPRLPYVYPSLATVVLRCEDILDLGQCAALRWRATADCVRRSLHDGLRYTPVGRMSLPANTQNGHKRYPRSRNANCRFQSLGSFADKVLHGRSRRQSPRFRYQEQYLPGLYVRLIPFASESTLQATSPP